MTRVFYDQNALFIDERDDPFPAGTLMAALDPTDPTRIMVRVINLPDLVLGRPCSDIQDINGTYVGDPPTVLAYLQGEFAKRRPVGLPPLTFTAGENMGGQRAVRVTGDGLVYLASADDPDEIGDTLGISMNAALAGDSVTVMIEGEMDDPSWSFAPGALFLGLAGALTQDVPAAPVAAFRQKLATVLGPTRLLVERSFPVLLA